MKAISLYGRRGKPERAMAEIRRALLRKISARIKSEGLDPLKEPFVRQQTNK
jgi:hypothetical protein